MKTYVIYVKNYPPSVESANTVLDSLRKYSGYEPELFEGLTSKTVNDWEKTIGHVFEPKPKSRAKDFLDESRISEQRYNVYQTKKACSLNRYRLYKLCITLDEPIVTLEDDVKCIRDWNNEYVFPEILLLNVINGIAYPGRNEKVLEANKRFIKRTQTPGVKPYKAKQFEYRHNKEEKAITIPGSGAVAVTPAGAKKLVDIYENLGWEQTDLIINTHNVDIKMVLPDLFEWADFNTSTSWGIDWKKYEQ